MTETYAGRPALGGELRRLCGWGRSSHSEAFVVRPPGVERLREAVLLSARHGSLIARGAGRSYGDAAQNGGGMVLDLGDLSRIELLDGPLLRAGAGATLAQILRALTPRGLTLPVLPGTRYITVGGAIAADVHGKNHRRDGSFGHHVQSLTLCTPDGALHEISRTVEPELFSATIGGMGLTGVIVEAIIEPSLLRAPLLDAQVDRVCGIEQALAVMQDDAAHRYSIAWVDLLGRGAAFGRSVVMRSAERPLPAEAHLTLPGRPRLRVPAGFPGGVLRPVTARAFNALRWRGPHGERRRSITVGENLFPLDALADWNRLYGRAGLLQYQFAVPEESSGALVEIVHSLRLARQPTYLAVIKRFGEVSGGMLSFPAPGWTVALDLPAGSPGLRDALDAADELLLNAGGRVYLAKDARLRAAALPAMYPRLRRFEEVRAAVDPQRMLRSDMARRLGLAPGAAE